MFDTKTVSLEWGGKTLTLETGRIARQADGAVLATYGETVVLCAVTAALTAARTILTRKTAWQPGRAWWC